MTLLELMIAMTVFLLGMVGLLQANVIVSRSDSYARRVDEGSRIALEMLTYLRTIPYDSEIIEVRTSNANGGDILDRGMNFNKATISPEMYDYFDAGKKVLIPNSPEMDFPDKLNSSASDPCEGTYTGSCFFQGYVHRSISEGPSGGRPLLAYSDHAGAVYERYWIVEWVDEHNELEGKRISVIVRWYEPLMRGHRRVVMHTMRYDPRKLMSI